MHNIDNSELLAKRIANEAFSARLAKSIKHDALLHSKPYLTKRSRPSTARVPAFLIPSFSNGDGSHLYRSSHHYASGSSDRSFLTNLNILATFAGVPASTLTSISARPWYSTWFE